MKRYSVGLLALVAACGPTVAGSGTPMTIVTPLTLEPPPIYGLLGYRSELNLTSQQVVTLDSIAQGVRVQTAPLVDQLRERSVQRQQQPGVFQVGDEGRPVLEEIRRTHREAVDEVRNVLSEEQQTAACRVFDRDQRRSPAARREQQAQRQQEARRGVQRDTLALGWGGRTQTWPWCAPAPAADPPTPAPSL